MVLVRLVCELVVAAEVPTKADLKEDEGAILAVKGSRVYSELDWSSLNVDDVRGSALSCRHQDVEVFLWEAPCRYAPGAATPSSSYLAASPYMGRVLVFMDTSTRRF